MTTYRIYWSVRCAVCGTIHDDEDECPECDNDWRMIALKDTSR